MQSKESGLVDLPIIIVNYNTFQTTSDCISSLYNTIRSTCCEIILIDNASKECDASLFTQNFPEIKLIRLAENVGFGRANNIGMEKAKGQYFLLLNSDTIVLDGTIDKSVRLIKELEGVDVIGCKSLFPDGNTQLTVYDDQNDHTIVGYLKRLLSANPLVGSLLAYFRKNDSHIEEVQSKEAKNDDWKMPNHLNGERIGSLNGVFLLFRRKIWAETNGFDPDFFMYAEETEWFLNRLKRYNKLYFPEVSIIHYCGKSDIYGKMSLQQVVSNYLLWYKVSYLHYFIYVMFSLCEVISLLILIPFKQDRKRGLHDVMNRIVALRYALWGIPRYSNRFGARKEMLKIDSLKGK